MTRPVLTASEIVELLREAARSHPEGVRGWARDNGFSARFVNAVLAGSRVPTGNLAFCLGLRKMTVFAQIERNCS